MDPRESPMYRLPLTCRRCTLPVHIRGEATALPPFCVCEEPQEGDLVQDAQGQVYYVTALVWGDSEYTGRYYTVRKGRKLNKAGTDFSARAYNIYGEVTVVSRKHRTRHRKEGRRGSVDEQGENQ